MFFIMYNDAQRNVKAINLNGDKLILIKVFICYIMMYFQENKDDILYMMVLGIMLINMVEII